MLKDKTGKVCVAKNVFVGTISIVLLNYILHFFFAIGTFDHVASIGLITVTGGAYYGRSLAKNV